MRKLRVIQYLRSPALERLLLIMYLQQTYSDGPRSCMYSIRPVIRVKEATSGLRSPCIDPAATSAIPPSDPRLALLPPEDPSLHTIHGRGQRLGNSDAIRGSERGTPVVCRHSGTGLASGEAAEDRGHQRPAGHPQDTLCSVRTRPHEGRHRRGRQRDRAVSTLHVCDQGVLTRFGYGWSCSEAKWVRKWIKRQRGNARRKSGDLNVRFASAKSTVPGSPSPEEGAVATMPPPAPQAQVAASVPPPHRHSPAYSTAGASPAAHSGTLEKLNATAVSGSLMQYPAAYYTASPVPAARPAAFRPPCAAAFQQLSGYHPPAGDTGFHSDDDFSSGAAYTYAAGPSSAAVYLPSASPMDSLAGQPGLPASSFSVPLHSDDPLAYETYPGAPSASLPQDHIALNALSPVFPLDYADPVYETTTEELQSSVEPANALLSSGFPATIAPAELSIPTFVPPTGLTASAAYLYEIFHDSTATSEAAPPSAPTANSVLFLPELTRPSDAAPPDLRAPLSAFASPTLTSQGYPGAPYPLSYQMRLSDLVALTKAIRRASAPPAAEHTRTHVRETDATMGTGHDGRAERAGKPVSVTLPTNLNAATNSRCHRLGRHPAAVRQHRGLSSLSR